MPHLNSPSTSTASLPVTDESTFMGRDTSGVFPYPGEAYSHSFRMAPNEQATRNTNATTVATTPAAPSPSRSWTQPVQQTTPIQHWYPWAYSSQPYNYGPPQLHQPVSTPQAVPTSQAASMPHWVQSTPSTSSVHTWVPQSQPFPTPQPVTPPQVSTSATSSPRFIPAPGTVSTSSATPLRSAPSPSPSLEPLLAPLKALQTQVTTLQGDCNTIKSDVKDALSALNGVRRKQTQTDKRISTLEDVIGIEPGCVTVKAKRRTRRGKRANGKEATAQPTLEVQAPVETEDIPTLIHTLACIQSSVEKLLSREIPQPHRPPIYRETATSPPPSPLAESIPVVGPTTLHSADGPASLPLPLSPKPIVILSQDPPTLLSHSVQEKLFVEASIQTCRLSSPPERACALGSRGRSLTLTPVDWSNDPSRPSAYTAEYMRFMYDIDRDLAIQNQTNVNAATSLDAQARLGRTPGESDVVTVDDLRRSVGVSSRLPTRTMSAPSLTSFASAVGVGGQHDDAQSASMRTAEATSVQALLGEGRVSSLVSAPSSQGVVDGLTQATPPRYRRASVGDLESREPEAQGAASSSLPSGVPNGTGDALASMSPASGSRLEADPMETRADPVTEPEVEETEREEDRMIMDFEDDQAPGMIEMADRHSDVVMSNESDSTSESPVMAQIRPSQGHPDDEDREDREDREEACPSGLPTPLSDGPTPGPSTAAAAATMSITHWTHNAEVDSKSLAIPNPERGGSLSRHFPVIFTPPSLTPPRPSSGEGEGEEWQEKGVRRRLGDGQGMGLGLGMISPLTPPPPSPFVRRQVRVVDDDDDGADDEACDRGETETEDPTDVVVTEADTGEEDEVSGKTTSLRSDPVYTGTAATSSSSEGVKENATSVIPAITITQDSQAATPPDTNADADPRVSGGHDGSSFVTPNSSPGLPEIDLREFHPDFSTADFMDGSSYEYHLGFGSPSLHPSHPTSTTTSGYQTPSDSTHPTQDEDEVWDTLLGLSGASTPTSLFMCSNYPSRAQSVHPEASSPVSSQHQQQETETEREKEQELLSIDPSMLHYPPQPPHESSPHVSERSLSPLTSLDETDLEDVHSHSTREKHTRGTESHSGAHGRKRLANTNKSRRSEPCHGSLKVLGGSMPPTRGASEMTSLGGSGGSGRSGSRPLGGPSASLEELMLMARRQPLKIHVKVPESMRGVKRKWSAIEGEIGGGDDGETVHAKQAASTSGHVAQEPEGREMSAMTEMADEVPLANMGVALTTPAPTPPASSIPATMTDPPPTYTLEDLVRHPLPVVPSKRTKRAAQEGSIKETPASRSRQKKTKGVSKPKSTQYPSYDVENGEVVMAAVPEPAPSVSVAPSPAAAPLGEETHEPSVNHERPLQEPVNHAMKTPPSSPIRPARSSGHSPMKIKQSPTKEDVWSAIAMGDGSWPELPNPFTRCDEQFIQCDNCDMWYHCGCVGIGPEDPRLEDGALFICPMCQTKSARRRALRKHDEACARPDCPEPIENTGLYFVERLVGRKRIEGGGSLWLAKWEGYPMTKATWIPEENINTGQMVLFKSFEEDALKEGINLSEESVLLEEAIEAGW